MTSVTWPPWERSLHGAEIPQRYAVDATGRKVAFVRELATRDGIRVCLFPHGDHNDSVEGRVPNDEAFAIKMASRWLSSHAQCQITAGEKSGCVIARRTT